jgi:hypothetical protein
MGFKVASSSKKFISMTYVNFDSETPQLSIGPNLPGMPPKRSKRSLPSEGLAPGEKLKRNNLPGAEWGWVGTEVSSPSDITQEHRLATCGLSKRNKPTFCVNKYASMLRQVLPTNGTPDAPKGSPLEDVIIISDDEGLQCTKKQCKSNPYCLNYLKQDQWEIEGAFRQTLQIGLKLIVWLEDARDSFLESSELGNSPLLDTKDPVLPVGLKVSLPAARLDQIDSHLHRILVLLVTRMLFFK